MMTITAPVHIDRNALITSIIASIDSQPLGEKPNMLTDEDFVLDPAGEWIKLEGGWWSPRISSRMFAMASLYPFTRSRRFGPTPYELECHARYKKRCEELDAMPSHRMVTTYEQRLLRYATQRADAIISGSR